MYSSEVCKYCKHFGHVWCVKMWQYLPLCVVCADSVLLWTSIEVQYTGQHIGGIGLQCSSLATSMIVPRASIAST